MRETWKWLAIPLLGATALSVGPRAAADGPAVSRSQAAHSLAPAALPAPTKPPLPQDAAASAATLPLRELFARQQFAEVLLRIPAGSSDPAQRLLRGISALKLGNSSLALEALTDLELVFPSLKTRIDALREKARTISPEFREFLPDLARSRDFDVLLGLTQRLLETGDSAGAERFVGHASRSVEGKLRRERRLRLVRAEIYLAQDRPFLALTDLRWLALEHPESAEASRAATLIEERFPKHPLTPEDKKLRIVHLAEHGAYAALTRELASASEAGVTLRAGEQQHLEGTALFQSAQYNAAATLLEQAASLQPGYAEKDRLKAARARSRLGQTDAALALYQPIASSKPATRATMLAAYYATQEVALAGRWSAAQLAYDEFLQRFAGSEYRPIAERGSAVSLFATGEIARARSAFKRLRVSASPNDELREVYTLLDGICLLRLGDVDGARRVFEELAQRLPASFAGIYARKHLRELGHIAALPTPLADLVKVAVRPLPELVTQLEDVGLFDFAELEMQRLEPSLRSEWAPTDAGTFCNSYGQLTQAKRRFEWGTRAASELSFFQNPNLMPSWVWRCFFPTPHRETTLEAASHQGLPPALIYAVMRQESGFRSLAVSHANAYGLMQIIEATGLRIAEQLKQPFQFEDLLVPAKSIEFGAFYLKHLTRQVQHPALTVAAYNAGPYAIRRLESSSAGLPFELLLLRIPFKETRGYVQRVLANAELYANLYPELGTVNVPLIVGEVRSEATATEAVGTEPLLDSAEQEQDVF